MYSIARVLEQEAITVVEEPAIMEESKEGDYKEEEAKEEEKREEEEDEDDNKVPVVKLVQNFCMTSGFEREFEAFAEDNFEVFSDASEMKDNEEHKLEFYDVYNLYLTTFEKKIEDYILSVSGLQRLQASCTCLAIPVLLCL